MREWRGAVSNSSAIAESTKESFTVHTLLAFNRHLTSCNYRDIPMIQSKFNDHVVHQPSHFLILFIFLHLVIISILWLQAYLLHLKPATTSITSLTPLACVRSRSALVYVVSANAKTSRLKISPITASTMDEFSRDDPLTHSLAITAFFGGM